MWHPIRWTRRKYQNRRNLPGLGNFYPRECLLQADRDADPKFTDAPLFVIVHGTWAQDAEWAMYDHALEKGLRKNFPGKGWSRFNWHSVNGIRPRLHAAAKLADALDDLSPKLQDRPIVVIAHSHGGNVAAWALSEIKNDQVAAVVYLNTPFIHFLGKEIPEGRVFTMENMAKSKDVHFFGMVNYLVAVIVAPAVAPVLATTLFFGTAVLPLSIGGCMSGVLFWYLVGSKMNDVTLNIRHAMRRLKALSLPSVKRKSSYELFVFSVGDEASTALQSVRGISGLAKRFGKHSLWVLPALGVFGFATFRGLTDTIRTWLPVAGIVAGVVMFAASQLARLCVEVAGHGLEQGLMSLDTDVSVSAAPVGHRELLTLQWSLTDTNRHSGVSGSEAAIAQVSDWLKPKVDAHVAARKRTPSMASPDAH